MKLQLYVARQLLTSLAFSVSGLLLVALPGLAVSTVSRLPGADAVVLLRYIPIALEALTPYVLPICYLLAVVATYGRLAADREWTAIQMAGVRPLKLLFPAFVLAGALGALDYWMLSTQLPLLRTKQKALLVETSKSILENLRPGQTSISFGGFQLDAQWMDPDTKVLHDVFVRRPGTEQEGTEGQVLDYHAETARFRVVDDVLHATLTAFYAFRADTQVSQGYSEELEFELPLDDLAKQQPSERARFITSTEIRRLLATGEAKTRYVLDYRFTLQYRRVLALSFLIFLGLGAPTGLILRKGTQLGALAVSAGYGLLYYVLTMGVANDLGKSGRVAPELAAWSPTVLGVVASLLLLRRALRC